jgi:hypothetical protein
MDKHVVRESQMNPEERRAQKKRILAALVDLLAKELRPLNLSESAGLRRLIKAIDPAVALPCQETVVKALHQQHAVVFDAVRCLTDCCFPLCCSLAAGSLIAFDFYARYSNTSSSQWRCI